ncbi:MAG: energy transducer TonB [Candidatus Omnitrophica bacterium]|nr:energy transducer TonB [Candidatus Omnitrophota bacterium]
MLLDKPLRIALLVSTIFHTAIFLPLPCFSNFPIQKSRPALKITYLAPKKVSCAKTPVKEKPAGEILQQAKRKNVSVEFKADERAKQKSKFVEKIEIPPQLPKEKEALYLDYYQSIREKIRRFVLESYPRFIACGEVCLYFVLLPDGKLKEIKVVEGSSSHNQLLKEIARISVREAAPFSPFPEDLNQAQLSFNVIISFELEN